MNIENSTHAFEQGAQGYDHLLNPETLRSLGRDVRVIDGANPQAIRLGESWVFKSEVSQPGGTQSFLWDSDGEWFSVYCVSGDRDANANTRIKRYPLQDLIETGMRVKANPTGRVIGYARRRQAAEVQA